MNGTRTMPPSRNALMSRVVSGAVAIAATLALLGCAAPTSITTQVVSHARWDAGRQPGSFSFDRLPSQQDAPDQQRALEATALPALQRAGFVPAEPGSAAVYAIQLGARVRFEPQRWSRWDPFWDPLWGSPFAPRPPWLRGAYPGAYMGPPGWAPGWSGPPPPPHARMQVDVLVRERAGGQVVYEAHARYDRSGVVDNSLWPALFDAAMRRFPTPFPEAEDIEVPLAPVPP